MTHEQISKMADELMNLHMPALCATGWKFRFNTRKRAVGLCDYRLKTIYFSECFVGLEEESVRQTLLHEIAHAIAGNWAKHGPIWRGVITRLGGKPERCCQNPAAIEKVVKIAPYRLVCKTCNYQRPVFRLTKRVTTRILTCGVCCPFWNPKFKLELIA